MQFQKPSHRSLLFYRKVSNDFMADPSFGLVLCYSEEGLVAKSYGLESAAELKSRRLSVRHTQFEQRKQDVILVWGIWKMARRSIPFVSHRSVQIQLFESDELTETTVPYDDIRLFSLKSGLFLMSPVVRLLCDSACSIGRV